MAPYLWAIMITFTRGVWLCFAGVLALFLLLTRKRLSRIGLVLMAVITIAIGLLWLRPDVISQINNRLLEIQNVAFRQEYALESIDFFVASPLTGSGAGQFDAAHRFQVTDVSSGSSYLVGDVSHNSLLLMLSDRGLLAVVPFTLLTFYLFKRSIRFYTSANQVKRRVIAVSWSGALIYLVTANTIEIEFFSYLMCVVWALLGTVDGLVDRQQALPANRD